MKTMLTAYDLGERWSMSAKEATALAKRVDLKPAAFSNRVQRYLVPEVEEAERRILDWHRRQNAKAA